MDGGSLATVLGLVPTEDSRHVGTVAPFAEVAPGGSITHTLRLRRPDSTWNPFPPLTLTLVIFLTVLSDADVFYRISPLLPSPGTSLNCSL